ncbi:hypothetical protein D3C77_767800 [compost metagenome]
MNRTVGRGEMFAVKNPVRVWVVGAEPLPLDNPARTGDCPKMTEEAHQRHDPPVWKSQPCAGPQPTLRFVTGTRLYDPWRG